MTAIKKIFAKVEGRPQRIELNLYVSGDEPTTTRRRRSPARHRHRAPSGDAGRRRL